MLMRGRVGSVVGMVFSIFIVLSFFGVFVAAGQEYPSRPIKLIIGFSPGGSSDITWRAMADPMGKFLGQPVVIVNKPGGGGSLGYTMVASSAPDGYTVGYMPLGSFINNYLMYDVSYNPTKDFTYISGATRFAESIVVKSDSPWKTWDEFVEYSKSHPNEVRIGFSGASSANTIATKWIIKELGLKFREVTFPGDGEGITALLGGHIDVFPGTQNIIVKDGRARMLLALTVDPIPGFQNVPTFKKLFGKDTGNAAGLMAPAGIPEPILSKLEKAVQVGTKGPGFLKVCEQLSMTPAYRNSKEWSEDVHNALTSVQFFLKDLNLLKKK